MVIVCDSFYQFIDESLLWCLQLCRMICGFRKLQFLQRMYMLIGAFVTHLSNPGRRPQLAFCNFTRRPVSHPSGYKIRYAQSQIDEFLFTKFAQNAPTEGARARSQDSSQKIIKKKKRRTCKYLWEKCLGPHPGNESFLLSVTKFAWHIDAWPKSIVQFAHTCDWFKDGERKIDCFYEFHESELTGLANWT